MTKIFWKFSFFKELCWLYLWNIVMLLCCLPQLVCRPCSKFRPARMRWTPQFISVGRLGSISSPLRRFCETTHHQGWTNWPTSRWPILGGLISDYISHSHILNTLQTIMKVNNNNSRLSLAFQRCSSGWVVADLVEHIGKWFTENIQIRVSP